MDRSHCVEVSDIIEYVWTFAHVLYSPVVVDVVQHLLHALPLCSRQVRAIVLRGFCCGHGRSARAPVALFGDHLDCAGLCWCTHAMRQCWWCFSVVLIERWTRRPREPLLAFSRRACDCQEAALRPARGRSEPRQLWSTCPRCGHMPSLTKPSGMPAVHAHTLARAVQFTTDTDENSAKSKDSLVKKSSQYQPGTGITWHHHRLTILHRHKHVSCTTITPQPTYYRRSTNLTNIIGFKIQFF